MSDTDSFIDEVNDEVRRDRLFGLLKRYGWIAALAIVLLVGGAAFSEYRKAQARAQAEALGDAMLGALEIDLPSARAQALAGIDAQSPEARAVVAFLTAAEQVNAEDTAAAVATLNSLADGGEVPVIYRQIASFKALTLQADTLDPEARRNGFAALAQPGSALRLLAEEQLALVEIAEGNTQAAISAYQTILEDAEVTPDLQQRALQVIVALGGTPDLSDLPQDATTGGIPGEADQ